MSDDGTLADTGEVTGFVSVPSPRHVARMDSRTRDAYHIFADYDKPGLLGFARRVRFELLGGPLYFEEWANKILNIRDWHITPPDDYCYGFLLQPGNYSILDVTNLRSKTINTRLGIVDILTEPSYYWALIGTDTPEPSLVLLDKSHTRLKIITRFPLLSD